MLKKLGKILAVALAAVLGLSIVLLLALWFGSRDLSSAGDEDMRARRVEIPAAENAFARLEDAASGLDWPNELDARVRDACDAERPDRAATAELLSRNQKALEALEAGLQVGRLQLPVDVPGRDMPYNLLSLRRLGQLLCFRARGSFASGKTRAAEEDVLRLLRFGALMENGQGGLLAYLIGNALQFTGLGLQRRLLSDKELWSQELLRLVGELAALRPQGRSFRQALQADYSYMAAHIDDPGRFEETAGLSRELSRSTLFSRYVFQPNASKKILADAFREIADSWDKSCSEVDLKDKPTDSSKLRASFWKPNIVGRTIAEIARPSMRRLLLGKCRLQTDFSATQLLVALRAYQQDNAELPRSLDLLIPDPLASNPLDDFDGKPLRYSGERRIVYSVGENLADDGGSPEKDQVFPIPF